MVDTNGQSLAYVYGHADQRDAQIANGLTLDEARRIASNIAKLPVCQAKADLTTALQPRAISRMSVTMTRTPRLAVVRS